MADHQTNGDGSCNRCTRMFWRRLSLSSEVGRFLCRTRFDILRIPLRCGYRLAARPLVEEKSLRYQPNHPLIGKTSVSGNRKLACFQIGVVHRWGLKNSLAGRSLEVG